MTSTITRWALAARHCTPVFKKGQSGNPGGGRSKELPALLADALNEPVFVTIDGGTPPDHQARGDRPSAGQQIDDGRFARDQDAVRHDEGRRAEGGGRRPPPEPRPLDEADKEVLQTFVERVRQQVLAEIAKKQRETAGSNGDSPDDG